MQQLERGTLLLALVEQKGNVSMAAHVLGLTAEWVKEECERHGIDPSRLPGIREAKQAFMVGYLEHLMKATEGRVSTAAEIAGCTAQGLHDHLRRYGVDADAYRSEEVKRALQERRRRARIDRSSARRVA